MYTLVSTTDLLRLCGEAQYRKQALGIASATTTYDKGLPDLFSILGCSHTRRLPRERRKKPLQKYGSSVKSGVLATGQTWLISGVGARPSDSSGAGGVRRLIRANTTSSIFWGLITAARRHRLQRTQSHYYRAMTMRVFWSLVLPNCVAACANRTGRHRFEASWAVLFSLSLLPSSRPIRAGDVGTSHRLRQEASFPSSRLSAVRSKA